MSRCDVENCVFSTERPRDLKRHKESQGCPRYIASHFDHSCSRFTGVPLENFSSIGTGALFKFRWSSTGELEVRWSSWGCSWTWPSCATARGMSRSPNSWMRQCLESELDGEFWLVKDPSQCKSTTWSGKVVVTFEQKLQPKIFAPTSSFRFNFEFNFGTILA